MNAFLRKVTEADQEYTKVPSLLGFSGLRVLISHVLMLVNQFQMIVGNEDLIA